jgi:hypothetical protein
LFECLEKRFQRCRIERPKTIENTPITKAEAAKSCGTVLIKLSAFFSRDLCLALARSDPWSVSPEREKKRYDFTPFRILS